MAAALRRTLFALALAVPLPVWAVELIMVDQIGCHYCAQWEATIGPIYPKTPEGKFAPLRRVDLKSDDLKAMGLSPRVRFTPTFVLMEDGTELARIEGYPGEDFFWGLLDMMLREHTTYEKLN